MARGRQAVASLYGHCLGLIPTLGGEMSWGYARWCTQYAIDKHSTQAYCAYVCLGGEGRGELYWENQDNIDHCFMGE